MSGRLVDGPTCHAQAVDVTLAIAQPGQPVSREILSCSYASARPGSTLVGDAQPSLAVPTQIQEGGHSPLGAGWLRLRRTASSARGPSRGVPSPQQGAPRCHPIRSRVALRRPERGALVNPVGLGHIVLCVRDVDAATLLGAPRDRGPRGTAGQMGTPGRFAEDQPPGPADPPCNCAWNDPRVVGTSAFSSRTRWSRRSNASVTSRSRSSLGPMSGSARWGRSARSTSGIRMEAPGSEQPALDRRCLRPLTR